MSKRRTKVLRLSGSPGHVFGGDHGSLHDEEVELGGQQGVGEGRQPLGGDRRARYDAGAADLFDAVADQFGFDRFGVHLLEAHGGHRLTGGSDLGQEGFGIVVAGPQPFQRQDSHAAKCADGCGAGRAGHAVHGGGHDRKVEAEGVDVPGQVDVFGVAGAPVGDQGDVVERVGPPPALAHADLDLSHGAGAPRTPNGKVRAYAVTSPLPEPVVARSGRGGGDEERSSEGDVAVCGQVGPVGIGDGLDHLGAQVLGLAGGHHPGRS